MKTQIIVDLCCAINSLPKDSNITKRLTKHMVSIAKNLRNDRNVNLGKLNKALQTAEWNDKQFAIVKKIQGNWWWNDLKLVEKK